MTELEEFISIHPLTKDQVEVMYTFLHDLSNLKDEDNFVNIGYVMDLLVQFYE